MTDLATLLQQGSANAWLFIPSAILLGALHGMEPGHSKTMMAAFIIAIRGTVAQAVMLGLAATASHTAVVWAVALIGLHFGAQWNAASSEPYLQLASGLVIIGIAIWMIFRTHHHVHHDDHDHGHDKSKRIDTGHGVFDLKIFEDGVPRFRLTEAGAQGHGLSATSVSVETERADGRRQTYSFVARDGCFESAEEIPAPHEFIARLHLGHGDHDHDFDVEFTEHGHHHAIQELGELELATQDDHQDPHELAHANDIRRRFANRKVNNGQILLFGLTGGLIPCPASITVLLLCLQLRQFTLGAALVLCFSIGLALTMVFSGVMAALSVKHISNRWSGFGDLARNAPYFSGGLISLVGLYVGYQGLNGLL
jgi:nickel/cobalt exporter